MLRKSSQACVRPVPLLRHRRRFPHARSIPLLQTIFGFDELAPQSVWSRAGNATAYQETRGTLDRKASIGTSKAAPFVRIKSDSLAKSLKRLERVKRSESNFSFDFYQQFQLLTPYAYFRVGRIVGRFVRRSIWLACHSKLVLPLWKSVKDWW
jgi:hypothetical protein